MRIVVGIDGSHQALTAAGWIAHLPLGETDEVVVASVAQRSVLVGTFGYIHSAAVNELAEAAFREAQQHAARAVEAAAAVIRAAAGSVSTMVIEGHPVEALCRVVEETGADLLVVGPHGRGRLEALFLGSISQGLLQALPTSVAVAREPLRPPERIILAVDGSPPSLDAARLLARFPLPASARIHALAVAGGLPLAVIEGHRAGHVENEEAGLAELEERTASAILDAAAEILASVGLDVARHIRRGDAKVEILAAATELEADLVVTGARGVGGFEGLILGSVSRAVSRAAPCSTLVSVARSREGQP